MIALGSKCLLFKTPSGESVPLSADMIAIELSGVAETIFDADFVDNAASAVFHYFKHELGRQSVTVAEFAEALEKALKSLHGIKQDQTHRANAIVAEADLRELAHECGAGCELLFFPRLRTEMRELLKASPQTLAFVGLRDCVKRLTGSRKWNLKCRCLKGQILSYLRECLSAEGGDGRHLSLVVK